MKKILITIFLLYAFSSTAFANFDISNVQVPDIFHQNSTWQHLYSTRNKDFYIDRNNSYIFCEKNHTITYIAYVLIVEKKQKKVLASVEKILYFYQDNFQIYKSRLLDFRNFNSNGVIDSPQTMSLYLSDEFKLLSGHDKILAEKVLFPTY